MLTDAQPAGGDTEVLVGQAVAVVIEDVAGFVRGVSREADLRYAGDACRHLGEALSGTAADGAEIFIDRPVAVVIEAVAYFLGIGMRRTLVVIAVDLAAHAALGTIPIVVIVGTDRCATFIGDPVAVVVYAVADLICSWGDGMVPIVAVRRPADPTARGVAVIVRIDTALKALFDLNISPVEQCP
jgi:hypothetical protein